MTAHSKEFTEKGSRIEQQISIPAPIFQKKELFIYTKPQIKARAAPNAHQKVNCHSVSNSDNTMSF
jgi:hypothetical protein